MYARLTKIVLGPDTQERAQEVAGYFLDLWTEQPGFRGITFLANYETGEYGALCLWDSKQEAELSALITQRDLETIHRGRYLCPPVSEIFEVYEPRRA